MTSFLLKAILHNYIFTWKIFISRHLSFKILHICLSSFISIHPSIDGGRKKNFKAVKFVHLESQQASLTKSGGGVPPQFTTS